MILEKGQQERLAFLMRIIVKEQQHLSYSANKLFLQDFNKEQALSLESDPELAETLEAFVSYKIQLAINYCPLG